MKYFIGVVIVFIIISMLYTKMYMKRYFKVLEERNVYKSYYHLLLNWQAIQAEGRSVGEFLLKNGMSNIAIYGAGMIGGLLEKELNNCEVNIKVYIDQKCKLVDSGTEVIDLASVANKIDNGQISDVDAIIITPVYHFRRIKQELLLSGISQPIVALDYLIWQIKNS
ncbi:hypothetical protein [Anoxynatronum buryatiense]|uniref:Uncharacterized protein n=1 Tax=Anoxynatronum buryatiense TaxID=489973 RepID=A0AA45WVE8_9CLOT|nr:hypothetical protein [Anoxynatronum buryatiense]SMP52533.1 hypothetical protein SAMN06296020_104255 [Anoxynatronum buryatiense]